MKAVAPRMILFSKIRCNIALFASCIKYYPDKPILSKHPETMKQYWFSLNLTKFSFFV